MTPLEENILHLAIFTHILFIITFFDLEALVESFQVQAFLQPN